MRLWINTDDLQHIQMMNVFSGRMGHWLSEEGDVSDELILNTLEKSISIYLITIIIIFNEHPGAIPELVTKILAAIFGFVPDWLRSL